MGVWRGFTQPITPQKERRIPPRHQWTGHPAAVEVKREACTTFIYPGSHLNRITLNPPLFLPHFSIKLKEGKSVLKPSNPLTHSKEKLHMEGMSHFRLRRRISITTAFVLATLILSLVFALSAR